MLSHQIWVNGWVTRLHKFGYIVLEVVRLLRAKTQMLVNRHPPAHYARGLPGYAPVVLIPGVLGTWGYMHDLASRLASLGHPVYIVGGLGQNLGTIEHSAGVVCALLEQYDLRGAVLVGYSKGAVVGKYLLDHDGERVAKLVAVGGPFMGAAMARLLPFRPYRELSPGSPALAALAKRTASHPRITSIYPAYDPFVQTSSKLPGATNVEVPVIGHATLMSEPKIEDAVIAAVQSNSIS